MLRLFQSIFGGSEEAGRYPEALVREAIERSVDGTDPWLRGLSGYRNKLRPAVVHAIDHVVALVNGMQDPLVLTREAYSHDPLLQLFFISNEHMANVLRSDPALLACRTDAGSPASPVWALLVMACEQRRTFGVDLIGETIVRDVPQVTVSMAGHRVLDPTTDLATTRRLLMRRAFDHLLTLALARIAAIREVRDDLIQHRTLLQAKHDALEGSGWGFGNLDRDPALLDVEFHRQLDEIDEQLRAVGGDDRYLDKNLEILIEVLAHAESQLWVQPLTLIVDRMGIRRSTPADDAPELELRELRNAAGRQLIVRMVNVPALATL